MISNGLTTKTDHGALRKLMIKTYAYSCSVCAENFMWSKPEPALGATCPSCYKSMMDEVIAWGEEQANAEEQLHSRMNSWWDNLPKDVQEKAFFCVVKKISDAELIHDRTYRQILHEDFGFDKQAYYLGIICGFMALHNSIVPSTKAKECVR